MSTSATPGESKTVLVTGAAGNLGFAVAQAFAATGASVAVTDRDSAALHRVYGIAPVGCEMPENRAATGSPGWIVHPADLLDKNAVTELAATLIQRWGRIDVLCNIAGGFHMGEAVHETSEHTLEWLLDLNVRTLLAAVRAVVPYMCSVRSGRVINVGASGALRGSAKMGAYGSTKSMVIRLTESMADELGEFKIGVNCVLPTTLDTSENRRAMPTADPSRWVSPEALADIIVFLASDQARAIQGAAIPVSGLQQ